MEKFDKFKTLKSISLSTISEYLELVEIMNLKDVSKVFRRIFLINLKKIKVFKCLLNQLKSNSISDFKNNKSYFEHVFSNVIDKIEINLLYEQIERYYK
jgi:hypothetical protein